MLVLSYTTTKKTPNIIDLLGTSVLYSIQAFIKSSVIAFWLDINNFIAHVQIACKLNYRYIF